MKKKSASLLLIAFIATGLSAAGTLVEPLVGVLAPIIEREIDVPGAMTGQFIAVMFGSSAVCALLSGYLADRVRPTRLAMVQLTLATVGFGIFIFASNAPTIFTATVIGGMAMSFMGPLSNRIIVNYLPSRLHASAIGWRSLGPQMGVVFIGTLFALTGEFVYWRITITIVTLLIIVFAVFAVALLMRRNTHDHSTDTGSAHSAMITPVTDRVANPIVWWLMPYTFLANGVISSVSAYMIYFAFTEIELPQATASVSAAVVSGTSIIARLAWVRIMTPRNAVRLMVTASLATAAAALLLVFSVDLGLVAFWVGVVMVGAFGVGASPMSQVLLVWNTNAKYIGRVSSVNGLVGSSGMTLQPFVMSLVVAAIGVAESWYVLFTCALLAGISMLLYSVVYRSRNRTTV